MKRFYTNREGGKRTKSQALQQAQIDFLYGRDDASLSLNSSHGMTRRPVLTDNEVVVEKQYRIPFRLDKRRPFAHPYYWSPFVLFGNWK
jgi:CHAT domain-containing protein